MRTTLNETLEGGVMVMRDLLMLTIIGGVLATTTVVHAQGIEYANDFEETCDLRFWVAGGEVELDGPGLTDDPAQGQRCARVRFTATTSSHYVYFEIPLEQPWEPGMSFLVDGMVKVDAPDYVSVALGVNRRLFFGDRDLEGNSPYTPTVEKRNEWVRLISGDVGEAFGEDMRVRGISPAVDWTVDSVYLHIIGAEEGDTITVWLDDLAVREPTEADRAEWARQEAEQAVDYVPPAHPELDDYFAWGVSGSLEGQNRILELPDEMVAAVLARGWRENFFDTSARFGGIVMHRHGDEGVENLARLLDLTAEHGFKVEASTYITGYYEPKVPREELEALARRVVERFKDHPALLAWYILDEPRAEQGILRDHWIWGRRLVESMDPDTPVLTAFNNPRSVAMYAPYTDVAQIDWYPVSRGGFEGRYAPAANAAMCEIAWENGARRVWFIPQAFANDERRLPTAPELRLMTYHPLACGATGILFFSWQSRPPWHPWGGAEAIVDIVLNPTGEIGEEVARLARVIPIIGPVLLRTEWVADSGIEVQCDLIPVYELPAIRADLNRGESYDVIVVTNQDVSRPQSATVTLPQGMVDGRMLMDLHRREPIALDGGSFELTLDPGDGRILALADAPTQDVILAGMDRRLREKLALIWQLELDEALACGVDVTAADDMAAMGTVDGLDAARDALQQALDADPRYSECATRVEALQQAIGAASARFGDYAWALPRAQRREVLEGVMNEHVAAMMESIRDWYRLRYALMTGEIDACLQALPEAEARLQATVAALDAALEE